MENQPCLNKWMNECLLLSVVQICRQSEEAELVLNLRSELIVSVVFECNRSESSHHMLNRCSYCDFG